MLTNYLQIYTPQQKKTKNIFANKQQNKLTETNYNLTNGMKKKAATNSGL